jgi:hypothetical protein
MCRKRKVIILCAVWVLIALAVCPFVTKKSDFSPSTVMPANCDPSSNLRKIKGLNFVQYADDSNTPLFGISFDNMQAVNGSMGVFKTGLTKSILIDDLKLEIFKPGRLSTFTVLYTGDKSKPGSNNTLCMLQELAGKAKEYDFKFFDASNAIEIRINQLEYSEFDANLFFLGIKSRFASANYKSKQIHLRGRVIITAGQTKLESSEIDWDPLKHSFAVKGMFMLSSPEKMLVGRGGQFDRSLNIKSLKENCQETKLWPSNNLQSHLY